MHDLDRHQVLPSREHRSDSYAPLPVDLQVRSDFGSSTRRAGGKSSCHSSVLSSSKVPAWYPRTEKGRVHRRRPNARDSDLVFSE
jgi:hypothetical protein